MAKSIGKLTIIRDAPVNWWVLNIVDVFGIHTSRIKSMETYVKYKVLMLKEEGDTSHVCQSYDQDYANQDKASFRYDTSVLHLRIQATIIVLNYLCLVNVDLQAAKKIPR